MRTLRLLLDAERPKENTEVVRKSMLPQPLLGPSETEEWRTLPGFPNYEISSIGRIRRTTYISAYRDQDGYRAIHLWDKNREYKRRVHKLMAEAGFLGPQPFPNAEVNHEDSDRTNARATNLN